MAAHAQLVNVRCLRHFLEQININNVGTPPHFFPLETVPLYLEHTYP